MFGNHSNRHRSKRRGRACGLRSAGVDNRGRVWRTRCLTALALLLAGCAMPHVESAEPADSADSAPDGSQPNGSAPNEEPPNEEEEPADPVLPPGADADGPALAVADVSAGEGDGMLRFTVTLGAAAAEQVTVSYATEDGTATAGADYRQTRGSLTFPPESSAARQVEVPVHDDRVAEGAETLILRLHDARGARLAVAAATGTIADDDARSVTVQPAALNVVEGGAATYTVVLGSRPTGTVTVTPAAASPELAVAPRQLSFTAANYHSPQQVIVSAAQDADAVADEPVLVEHTVRGGGYGGAAVSPLTATILEDDVSTLAVAPAYAAEHALRMTFEVSLSLASDGAVTVEFATGAAEDTAAEGQDYAGTSGTLRFPARSTDAQVIEVTVHDDALDEDDPEHFTVTLSNPANAELAGGGATVSATGEIEDDDPKPRLSIADASLSEGAGGAMPFAVRLDPPSGRTVAVHYATADATAVAGSDYTRVSGTLTFPAGTTRRTIAVPVADDLLDEEEEHFTVTLSAAVNATMAAAPPLATGTIADDDAAVSQLSIADASLTEGAGDAMPFVVRLDPPSGRTVAVHYATADATAVAGSDYTRVGGTLTFPAGTTRRTIAVPVADDLLDEEDQEHFTLTLERGGERDRGIASARHRHHHRRRRRSAVEHRRRHPHRGRRRRHAVRGVARPAECAHRYRALRDCRRHRRRRVGLHAGQRHAYLPRRHHAPDGRGAGRRRPVRRAGPGALHADAERGGERDRGIASARHRHHHRRRRRSAVEHRRRHPHRGRRRRHAVRGAARPDERPHRYRALRHGRRHRRRRGGLHPGQRHAHLPIRHHAADGRGAARGQPGRRGHRNLHGDAEQPVGCGARGRNRDRHDHRR